MAIEAPVSKFTKTNIKIYIAVCAVTAIIFAYDGYLSKYKWSGRYNFYKEQVLDNDGIPTQTMNFNRKSPPFFIGAAALFAVYFFVIRNRKLVADENELVFSAKEKIPYDSIEAINKTYFEKKGFFVITHKNEAGNPTNLKISDRKYDNLAAILDHLVAKIS
ncbi:MAG: hypothetical protein ACYSUX_08190 [Planctomycetota bacterium]|jgi:hypothetical protein